MELKTKVSKIAYVSIIPDDTTFTWLIAGDDFIISMLRESFKSYIACTAFL
jgi:hypothetical protein